MPAKQQKQGDNKKEIVNLYLLIILEHFIIFLFNREFTLSS